MICFGFQKSISKYIRNLTKVHLFTTFVELKIFKLKFKLFLKKEKHLSSVSYFSKSIKVNSGERKV